MNVARCAYRRFVLGLALTLAGSIGLAKPKDSEPNFYTSDTPSKPAKASGTPQSKSKQTIKSEPDKTSATPRAKSAAKSTKETQGTRTSTGTGTRKNDGEEPVKRPAVASTNTVQGPLIDKVAYDPYRLGKAIVKRWDLLYLLPTAQEYKNYKLGVLNRNVKRLEQALSYLDEAAAHHERNMALALNAMILLQTARRDQSPFDSDRFAPHVLVIREALRHDEAEARSITLWNQHVREALDSEAERLYTVEQASNQRANKNGDNPSPRWLPSHVKIADPDDRQIRRGVTIASTDEARMAFVELSSENVFDDSVQEALISATKASQRQMQNLTLQSLSLSGPAAELNYQPIVDPSTPLPDLPAPDQLKPFTPDEPPAPPEQRGLYIAAIGKSVVAPVDGTVVFCETLRGYGNTIILQHGDNWFSVYGFLSTVAVSNGQHVKKGDRLATPGNIAKLAAQGIYFEVRKGLNPVNAREFLKAEELAGVLFR